MELIHPPHLPSPIALMPRLQFDEAANEAANGPGQWNATDDKILDINLLVAQCAGNVAARVLPGSVDIELDLCPFAPEIIAPPAAIAFAISGVLVAQLRSLEDSEDGIVRIKTQVVRGREVHVSILSNGVPPLRTIRAVEGDSASAGESDPTIAHCRRLLEQHGGSIQLRDEAGFIGFELTIPSLPLCNPAGLREDSSAGSSCSPLQENESTDLAVAS